MLKLHRAFKKAKVGQYPRTANALARYITAELYKQLTSTQLALVLDAIQVCTCQSKVLHEQDIMREEAVWDSSIQKMREVV